MNSHGTARTRTGPEDPAREKARLEREHKKIVEYRTLLDEFHQKRKENDKTEDMLNLTGRILELNAEFPTGWNERRRVLNELFKQSPQEKQTRLDDDLKLTMMSMLQNPKNYSVWEHRKWVLRTSPQTNWKMELKAVESQLSKDARNFHAWNYRRYVVEAIKSSINSNTSADVPDVSTTAELAYTKRKIAESPSNFSAWHYRSKLIDQLILQEPEMANKRIQNELDLVRNAVWTDSNDQSAWVYYWWIVSKLQDDKEALEGEMVGIQELLEEDPDCRWAMEALVRYNKMMGKASNSETQQMLERLMQIDSDRKERYQSLLSQ